MIRHGQSGDPCQRGDPGVYKSSVFDVFYGEFTDWVQFSTAIWVLHFGSGKTLKTTV